MSIRSRGIIIDPFLVLIRRKKENKEYFVFPGGGVEKNKTTEEAVIREVKEETGLDIKVNKLLYAYKRDNTK